jgi:hypothetical protein
MLKRPDYSDMLAFDSLDRTAIAYLTLPLLIFLVGWFEWWVALPLVLCVGYALKSMVATVPGGESQPPLAPRFTKLQMGIAVGVGCGWALFAGAGHVLFANADWYVRDAVLHDLVTSRWPISYGLSDGKETLLRAPLGFYLPAALIGKWAGLLSADRILGLWTALGASLFLLQVMSLLRSRATVALLTAAVIVLFSGFDIIGNIISAGPRFLANWDIAEHLEWWAGSYQYSSMTTQLFWVPNHALGGWLMIGLMARHSRYSPLDAMLPLLLVAAALWSPLSAVGVVPFAALRAYKRLFLERHRSLAHPRVWLPALLVGAVVCAYLILDPGGIPKGFAVSGSGVAASVMDLLRQAQFFLLEAGFIGFAVLLIRPSAEVVVALGVLALLPLAYLGPGNDLVMRGSIPSIAVLAVAACLALSTEGPDPRLGNKKVLLLCLLAIGAVTPVQEFARAVVLNAWPMNLQATMIDTNCGSYPPHYVARLSGQAIQYLLRAPHRLAAGPRNTHGCAINPAMHLMLRRGLL